MSQPKNQNEEFKSDKTISEVRKREREGKEKEKKRERKQSSRRTEETKRLLSVPNHFIDQKEACLAS